jgi:hypothetical protein
LYRFEELAEQVASPWSRFRIRVDPRPVIIFRDLRKSAMPRKKTTFDTVRELAAGLADVEEATAYGSSALKVRGSMFACMAIHRSAEPNSLVVRIDFSQRDELIAAEPDVYYLTDHYVNYPSVLVRLGRVHRDALKDLLRMAWEFASTRSKRPVGTRRRKRSV